MANYSIQQLADDGPPFAMALLMESISHGKLFVTYGEIRAELEHQLNIERIFPTQIGHVAGSMMDQILQLDPKAPLINVLITRADGIPGIGAGWYLAERYGEASLKDWNNISKKKKLELVDRERKKVFRYRKWKKLNSELFGDSARKKLCRPPEAESDFVTTRWGGAAESEEHKKLKEWVSNNPKQIGLQQAYGVGEPELRLLSGDEVDVMFTHQGTFRAVEVKSIRSSDDDLRRGIYQCVKYREVKRAETYPYEADIEAILVTERKLPSELQERARQLGIKTKCVAVNARDSGGEDA